MMGWNNKKIGEMITIKHGYAFKGSYFSDHGSHIVLTPGNFFEKGGFRIQEGKEKWYTGPIPGGFVLNKGDLIVAMTEQGEGLLGSSAIVPNSNLYLHNQRLGLVNINNERELDKNFLYYLFNLKSVRNQIRGSSSGTKVRHTSPGRIYEVKISIPDLKIQKKISSIISTYDLLIENNEKRIKILEEMAQRLYTEWFVKFKFPGHEKVKMIDGGTEFGFIPEGWEIVPLNRLANFLNGYPFKPEHLGEYGLPIVKIPELRDGILDKTPRNSGESIPNKYLINNGDILFSWSATLLVNIWNSGNALLNQHLFKVTPKETIYKSYIFYSLKKLIQKISKKVVGATMQHLRKDTVEGAKILLPEKEVLGQYESIASQCLEEIGNLNKQNQNLQQIRDLLIPQLVTGKRELENKTQKVNKNFLNAVLFAEITKEYIQPNFYPTHLRLTKTDYFLHRYMGVNPQQEYSEYMFGPYNPKNTYAGAESVAIKSKYIRRITGGFALGEKVNNLQRYDYQEKKFIKPIIDFLRGRTDEDIELLATVDYIIYKKLLEKTKPSAKIILEYIHNSSIWEQKIKRLSITQEKVEEIMQILRDFAQKGLPYPSLS